MEDNIVFSTRGILLYRRPLDTKEGSYTYKSLDNEKIYDGKFLVIGEIFYFPGCLNKKKLVILEHNINNLKELDSCADVETFRNKIKSIKQAWETSAEAINIKDFCKDYIDDFFFWGFITKALTAINIDEL